MIIKDCRYDLGTMAFELYTFGIECDKCKSTLYLTMPSREQTQRALYNFGWRVNSQARKYIHLCGRCGKKAAGRSNHER